MMECCSHHSRNWSLIWSQIEGVWSITMYDTSYDGTAGYMIENPINRYLFNSTTKGLVYGDDGSLTITIQHEQP